MFPDLSAIDQQARSTLGAYDPANVHSSPASAIPVAASSAVGAAASVGSAALSGLSAASGVVGSLLAAASSGLSTSAPSSQKADVRPISFTLLDASTGRSENVSLYVRPEDLTGTKPSRFAVHQSLGGDGAWLDDFGPGVKTMQISGHTGWHRDSGGLDGIDRFVALHSTVFARWHEWRAAAVQKGVDPNKISLIYTDALDNVSWVVVPGQFVLKRNRQRPLLAQYQISMTWVADHVSTPSSATPPGLQTPTPANASASLGGSVSALVSGASALSSKLTGSLAGLGSAVGAFTNMTAGVLSKVESVVAAGESVVSGPAQALVSIALNLASAGENVAHTIATIKSIPQSIKADVMAVAQAFTNAKCVISNVFRSAGYLPDYSSLYGASNCSSTTGGSPASQYVTSNPFPALYSAAPAPYTASPSAASSLSTLSNCDPALAPLSPADIASHLQVIAGGLSINSGSA